MMRKFVCGILILAFANMGMASAQHVPEVDVRITQNQIVYSGPSENSMIYEYIAAGRVVDAVGRNGDSSWVMINMNRQVVGWVPVESVSVVDGAISDLLQRPGKVQANAGSAYAPDNDQMRAAQIEMIRIQRPLRFIVARYHRLQGFSGASCEQLPTPPSAPNFSARQIAAAPELERIQRELTFVQEQTELAILIYGILCEGGGEVTEETYLRGIQHINAAQEAYTVLLRYIEELTGLQELP